MLGNSHRAQMLFYDLNTNVVQNLKIDFKHVLKFSYYVSFNFIREDFH